MKAVAAHRETSPLRATRRQAIRRLATAAAVSLAIPAFAQRRDRVLRVGAIFDNSGTEKASGADLFQGSSACFNAINRAGGIHGMQVDLRMADDRFSPEFTRAGLRKFMADPAVVALLHPVGTRQTALLMDAARGMPIVGPYSGTLWLRRRAPANTFWVRASYEQEIGKLVSTAVALGIERIGLVHPDDAFGKPLRAGFEAALARWKLKPAVMATTPDTPSPEVAPAAQAVADASPQVVIVALAGTLPAFVRALREAHSTSTVYGLSIATGAGVIEELGELGRGLGCSIVVPSPFTMRHEVVRRYRADMAASGFARLSLPSLEGYIDACVLAQGLRRAGAAPSRGSVIAALEHIRNFDLGGFKIDFGRGRREGSRFVDVAVIGERGRMRS